MIKFKKQCKGFFKDINKLNDKILTPFRLQKVFMDDLKKQFKKVIITGGKYQLDVYEMY